MISDDGGKTVATARLEGGNNRVIGCERTFSASLPPSAFYEVGVGEGSNAASQTYSREKLEDAGGRIEFTVR